MHKVLISICAVALAFTAVGAFAEEGEAPGAAVFEAMKCNMCHSVTTAGIEAKSEKMFKGDLIDIDHDAKWLVQYMKQEIEIDGEPHKKPFKGTDEELQALVDWLLEQKSG